MEKEKETSVTTPSFEKFCKERGVDFLTPQELVRLPLVVQILELEFKSEMKERYQKETQNSQNQT